MESILVNGISPVTIVIGLMYLWSEIKHFRSKGEIDDQKILALEQKIEGKSDDKKITELELKIEGKGDDKKMIGLERKIDHLEASLEIIKTKVNLVEADFNTFKRAFDEIKITINNLSTETRLEAKQQNKKMQLIFVGLQLICKEKGIDLKSFDLDQD